MPRNTSGLKRGGSGRPKGALNKATQAIKELSRTRLEDPRYVASLDKRLVAGKAPHMETLLHHYAYGKPAETVDMPQMAQLAEALSKKVVDEIHPGPGKASL